MTSEPECQACAWTGRGSCQKHVEETAKTKTAVTRGAYHEHHDPSKHVNTTIIRHAIRNQRIDRVTDLMQDALGIHDAIILSIIDPEESGTEFSRLIDDPTPR